MFKNNVWVITYETAHFLSQTAPLRFILSVFIGPKLIALFAAINYMFNA